MYQFLKKIIPYWPIFTTLGALIVTGLFWIRDVSGYGGRINMLETFRAKQEKTMVRMDYNIQYIAKKIGASYLEKPKEDKEPE